MTGLVQEFPFGLFAVAARAPDKLGSLADYGSDSLATRCRHACGYCAASIDIEARPWLSSAIEYEVAIIAMKNG